MRVVQLVHGGHAVLRGDERLDLPVIGPHPQLLQQVHIVLLLLDQLADGLHPEGLVVGPQGGGHPPGVEGHHLEADQGPGVPGVEPVCEEEGGGEAEGAEEEEGQAAEGRSPGRP